MDALARELLRGLKRSRPDRELLRAVGEPEPDRACSELSQAVGEPDLAASCEIWVPALLRSARPGFAAQTLKELARRVRSARGRALDLGRAPALPIVLGSSNFLARALLRHPEWIADLEGDPPKPPEAAPSARDWDAIRRAKYRGLLRVAARDLLGRPFRESLRELSDLADGCLTAALACAARETGSEAPALFALGKLGGRELNLSSDVDLIFLHDAPPDGHEERRQQAVAGLIRHFKSRLEAPTSDGFVYRVDLDLRPEGRTGVLANTVSAALNYYETFGQEWERQMLIRLRPLAGPQVPAQAFAREITPFVYRRSIDPGVMREVRAMKQRIEAERRKAGHDLERNLKEGPGGIRDVEFLVQSLQLFYGGPHPELRTGNVLEALGVLGALGLLPETTTSALVDGYTWLRRIEHALQLAEEQSTTALPSDPLAQMALARRSGYGDAEGESARNRLLEDWTAVRSEVRTHFEALVLREEG